MTRLLQKMYKPNINNILGIFTSGSNTLGGIVKFKNNIFTKINGFPNNYWGWGHEDKDLSNRAEYYDCHIRRIIKFDEYKKAPLFSSHNL